MTQLCRLSGSLAGLTSGLSVVRWRDRKVVVGNVESRRQLLERTITGNNSILCLQLGNENKTKFTKKYFRFTSTTPITELPMTLKFYSTTTNIFPLYFHVPSAVLVLDSVWYRNYKTSHSTHSSIIQRKTPASFDDCFKILQPHSNLPATHAASSC